MSAAEYTDVLTEHGTIRVLHEITLGDIIIFTVLAFILTFTILKWLIEKIWE